MTVDATFVSLQSALSGEYSLERELGRGGMGIVYLAREVALDRLVAIKVLPGELAARSDIRERFLREARTSASLSHPNIVAIHRVGEAGGLPYFVMTFVRGETLGERLRARGPVPATLLTRMLHDVSLALGYAHGRGVVHRDVKPDNILIEAGTDRALVTDFGIAQLLTERSESPAAGTAQFASPEQLRGDALDGRSDVYSLGIVAFIAATGRFPARTDDGTDWSESTAAALRHLPLNVVRSIERCLEIEPTRRFENAEQLARQLNEANAPVRTQLPIPLRMWVSTPTPLLGIAQIVALVSIAGANMSLWGMWAYRYADAAHQPSLLNRVAPYLVGVIAPFLLVGLLYLHKAQRLLAEGYGIADLRLALSTWIAERREELAFEMRTKEATWIQSMRALPWTFLLALPAIMAIAVKTAVWYAPQGGRVYVKSLESSLWGGGLLQLMAVLVPITFAIMLGMNIPLFSPRIRRATVGKVQRWFWSSRVGALVARMITPHKRGVPDSHFRPTELVLGLAVEELFAALPASYRAHVGDLPLIASRLTVEATALRGELQRLEEARAELSAREAERIEPAMAEVRTRLGKTVSTMETMRLELLRLQGGATDTRPLTTSLDAARQMIDDLIRLREAESEADQARKALPLDLRNPSPA